MFINCDCCSLGHECFNVRTFQRVKVEQEKILDITAEINETQTQSCFQAAWIGLYDDLNSWRWSLSDGSFYKHGEADFRQWASTEPNNFESREHCTHMHEDEYWNDLICNESLLAVCSDIQGENMNCY